MNSQAQFTLLVSVDSSDGTRASASRAAEELRQLLLTLLGTEVTISTKNLDPSAQDVGTILVLICGTAAAATIAKGIAAHIAKRGSRVTITTPEGSVVATGDAAHNIDVALTTAALRALPQASSAPHLPAHRSKGAAQPTALPAGESTGSEAKPRRK